MSAKKRLIDVTDEAIEAAEEPLDIETEEIDLIPAAAPPERP